MTGWPTCRARSTRLRPWLRAVSPVYETAPWGPVPQDDYLNAVVVVERPRGRAGELAGPGPRGREAAGRTREVRWGPRTLDVDVIDVDGLVSDDPT